MTGWSAVVLWLLDRLWPNKATSNRKKLLKELLNDSRFPQGRSLEELMRKTGTSEAECKRLLSEIGGMGIKLQGDREGWTLGDGK